jgi:hypothetical protein
MHRKFVLSPPLATNNCTPEAPCRSLQRGIKRTPEGGVLVILDSGSYGKSAVIERSITIAANRVSATVGALTVNAPGATVTLRGLTLNGSGGAGGTPGLLIGNAAAVHVLRCTVERFAGHPTGSANGIRVEAANALVSIADTTVRHNGSRGLLFTSGSAGSRLIVANSRFEQNGSDGIAVLGSGVDSTLIGVVSTRTGGSGVFQNAGTGGMSMTATTVADNGVSGFLNLQGRMAIQTSVARGHPQYGLRVGIPDHETGPASAVLSKSVITNNERACDTQFGTFHSRGNNTIWLNGNWNGCTGALLNGY